jgi:hypothetical protein
MKHLLQNMSGVEVVHYEGILGDAMALCGQDISGDMIDPDDYWGGVVETNRRVTCEDCRRVVAHVRGTLSDS